MGIKQQNLRRRERINIWNTKQNAKPSLRSTDEFSGREGDHWHCCAGWEEGAAGSQADKARLSCSGQQLSPNPHWRERATRSGSHDYLEWTGETIGWGPVSSCLSHGFCELLPSQNSWLHSGAGSGQAFSPLQLHNLKGKVTPPSPHWCAWLLSSSAIPSAHQGGRGRLSALARGRKSPKQTQSHEICFVWPPLLSWISLPGQS